MTHQKRQTWTIFEVLPLGLTHKEKIQASICALPPRECVETVARRESEGIYKQHKGTNKQHGNSPPHHLSLPKHTLRVCTHKTSGNS